MLPLAWEIFVTTCCLLQKCRISSLGSFWVEGLLQKTQLSFIIICITVSWRYWRLKVCATQVLIWCGCSWKSYCLTERRRRSAKFVDVCLSSVCHHFQRWTCIFHRLGSWKNLFRIRVSDFLRGRGRGWRVGVLDGRERTLGHTPQKPWSACAFV